MSRATFRPGDEVYDIHGRAGSFVAMAGGGFIVEPIFEADDYEPRHADVETWREAFAVPPTAKLHAEVAEIEKTLIEAQKALAAVRSERSADDAAHQERLKRLKKFVHLSRVDDYIEGRITHFVALERYSDVITIKTFDELMRGDGRRSSLPLLVLYGDAYSDRDMHDTHWCQLSDGDTRKVMPCTSLEEAKGKAQAEIDNIFAAWRKDPKGNYGHSRLGSVTAGALRSGLHVPVDVMSEVERREQADLQQQLVKGRAELAKAEAAVMALEAKATGSAT